MALHFHIYLDKELQNEMLERAEKNSEFEICLFSGFELQFQTTKDENLRKKWLERMGYSYNEYASGITLHSFRRFVKTTISDLGFSDYSEYFIGHSGSTYWTKKDSEKAEIFRKVEPYLTFLNIVQLERQGADIQTKVGELEDLNQSLRDLDKML